MVRCVVFTDLDLDGAGSLLTFKWFHPNHQIDTVGLKVSNLRDKLLSWLKTNSFESYDEVYFFDLDTSSVGDLIDRENVTIIDHHGTNTYNYKSANTDLVVTTSTSKLIYNKYKKESKIKLSFSQVELLSLIDDYDSYTLKFANSYSLDILFWYYSGDRISHFCERFKEGFKDFTDQEKVLINTYRKRFAKYYRQLRLYDADISIKGKQYKFISTFVDKYVNDVAHCVIRDNEQCDITMLINPKSKRVYFRKRKGIDVNLGKLAAALCEGGGHEYAAGGVLNERIKILSKDFQPIP